MEVPIRANLIAELMDQHAAALELYAAGWTDAPQDCVQEAFVELARRSSVPEQTAAWLFRVVRNRALNMARSQRRRVHHEQIAARLLVEKSQHGLAEIDKLDLGEALQALSAMQRELVVLRVWSGLSWSEIAELMELSSSGAQRHYASALQQLRNRLEPSCLPNLICRPN